MKGGTTFSMSNEEGDCTPSGCTSDDCYRIEKTVSLDKTGPGPHPRLEPHEMKIIEEWRHQCIADMRDTRKLGNTCCVNGVKVEVDTTRIQQLAKIQRKLFSIFNENDNFWLDFQATSFPRDSSPCSRHNVKDGDCSTNDTPSASFDTSIFAPYNVSWFSEVARQAFEYQQSRSINADESTSHEVKGQELQEERSPKLPSEILSEQNSSLMGQRPFLPPMLSDRSFFSCSSTTESSSQEECNQSHRQEDQLSHSNRSMRSLMSCGDREASNNRSLIVESPLELDEPSPMPSRDWKCCESTAAKVLERAGRVLQRVSWHSGLDHESTANEKLLVEFPGEEERRNICSTRVASSKIVRSEIFSSDGECDTSFLPGANEDLTWAVGLSSPAVSVQMTAASTFGRRRLFRCLSFY